MAASEAEMEQYAQMLDELCEKDPQAYEQLMQMMREQVAAAGGAAPPVPGAAPSMMDMIKGASSGAASPADGASAQPFKPQFPGNKVMEADGLAAKQEGLHIEVTPGFVMKTKDLKTQQKVFVNFCYSSAIQTFSQRKQLDDQGNEQEGLHVPLSLGAPHEVEDKSGNTSLAFDVAVNTQVIEDCKSDKTGSFRNFVCELAIEYIDQKYKIKLDARFKLPKLIYRGELPPPKHYIRKTQKPIIEEVDQPPPPKTSKTKAEKKEKARTAVASFEIFELSWDDGYGSRGKCSRVAAVDADGTALSEEMLRHAGSHLAIRICFQSVVSDTEAIEALELRPEHFCVKASGHQDLAFFLPFPVLTDEAEVTLDKASNTLEVVVPIDKSWSESEPDCGSAPWLLAQALRDEKDVQNKENKPEAASNDKQPKSLVEMFHLAMPQSTRSSENDTSASDEPYRRAKLWDPVDEDEELPEDRFHRKDMMSMHILEQRKKERQQKAQEADEKRKSKRAEVEEKQRKAREAGKTWREMYPNEPETTFIDMDEILQEEKQRRAAKEDADKQPEQDERTKECHATENAKKMAAAWFEEKRTHGLDLQSALAFDLLE